MFGQNLWAGMMMACVVTVIIPVWKQSVAFAAWCNSVIIWLEVDSASFSSYSNYISILSRDMIFSTRTEPSLAGIHQAFYLVSARE